MQYVSKLKQSASNYTVMCVDDNESLIGHLYKFLQKFFGHVLTAKSGQEGLKRFLEHRPDLIITDIEMSQMNGLEMIKQIKKIDREVPVIIMTAYDEKEYLLDSIRYGVVNYLKKPAKTTDLAKILYEALDGVKAKKDRDIFVHYLQHIFDYQNNMIVLIQDKKPLVANPIFLNFFKIENVEALQQKGFDIGEHFLEHKGFLCNSGVCSWYDEVVVNPGKHYHVKMLDPNKKENFSHFLIQYQDIPEKPGYGMLLLDDITDLNLLAMFNDDARNGDEIKASKESIKNALQLIVQRKIDVKIHNFYKGLSITNPAKIIEADESTVVLQCNSHQLRASEFEKSIVINSDALPHFILCKEIVAVNYDSNVIVGSQLCFMSNSPTQRKNIRIEPRPEHTVSFVFNGIGFDDGMSITDISVDAVKIKMIGKPVSLSRDDTLTLQLTLYTIDREKVDIQTPATLIREHVHDTYHHLVFGYELEPDHKRALVDYIAHRQMELIREFKRI